VIEGSGSRFRKRLGDALRPDGWRRSGEAPVATVPAAGTFVRPLDNGWVAVLSARWYGRDEIELPSWLPGTHGVVVVGSSATFAPAERLGAQLGLTDPSCGFKAARSFAVPGQEPGYRQFRGPEDDERVVAEIADYAQYVLVPAAERNAGLDGWMADRLAAGRGEPSRSAWTIPVMLLAHGRERHAMYRLEAARRDPELADDEAFGAFADRVEEFVRSGEALPTDGEALRAVARVRAELVVVSRTEAARAEDEPDGETSGWEALGGLVLIIAVVVYLFGKGAAVAGLDLGWGWLPAAAMVAFGVLKIGEHTEELREKWGDRGSADRVREYLERQREERERRIESADEDSSEHRRLDEADDQDNPVAPSGSDASGS